MLYINGRTTLPHFPINKGHRLYFLAAGDVSAITVMITAGSGFDHHAIGSVITLGGHHLWVLYLAACGLGILSVLAPLTGGFAEATRLEVAAIALASMASVIALSGMLLLAAIALLGVLLVLASGRLLRL
jgi:hypothetical protein